MFPALYRLSNSPNLPVSAFLVNLSSSGDVIMSWDLKFSRNLTAREEEASSVFEVLEGVRLKDGIKDRRAWKDDPEVFSVKSFF